MGKHWLHDTPKFLEKYKVNYRLVPGWELRSRSSGGFDSVLAVGTHHTASSRTASPEAEIRWQTQTASTKPIGNFLIDRSGVVHLTAAGATNTQGKGGPVQVSKGVIPKDRGNVHFISIEASNDGRGEPWSGAQMDSYVRVCAALCEQWGLNPLTDVLSHWEWVLPSSPNRKVDPTGPTPSMPDVGGVDGNRRWNDQSFRNRVFNMVLEFNKKPDNDGQLPNVPESLRNAKMYTVTQPTRVYDSRQGKLLTGGSSTTVKTNLPKGAVAAHVVVTGLFEGNGFVTAWASGARPNASVLNGKKGDVLANAVTVPLASNGTLRLFNSPNAHLIVDVMGYHSN